ncbi:MAG: amidohydrolase [Halanaerobiales bacterium]
MFAIKNAKILTMDERGEIERGTILVKDGKIKEVGENVNIPENAEIIEAEGKFVIPGMIDAHTHLGVSEEGVGWEGADYNETSDPITPHLRGIDAINPNEEGLKDAYKGGITAAMTGPGSANVMGGENLVIKTRGKTVDKMIVKNPAGIKAAFGENPKRVYNEQKKSPRTRMAVAAEMRKTLMQAEDYMVKKKKAKEDNKPFERDIKMESVLRILNKELPLKAHAHRADDIMTILRIAREFDIEVTLEHCTEGHKVAEEIAKSGFPAIVGPSMTTRSKVELKDRTYRTPAILAEAGVKVALMSDHPVVPINYLPLYAALAVKSGMERKEALKAITINPAEILGVDDRIGSIKKGKDADLAIFNGDPLAVDSEVEQVFIDGEKVNKG